MKKSLLVAFTFVCCLAWTLPAFAVDMEYGGYWRTRAYTMSGFTGDSDDESMDFSKVDARGRLWTKMLVNDELSWTNRFEFNVIWGDEESGGGIATDGTDYLRIKHSFVDLDTAILEQDLHFRIGLQGYEVCRGMLFSDDFAGLKITYATDIMDLDLVWMKAFEGATLAGEYEEDLDDLDVDFLTLQPLFRLADDTLLLRPFVSYLTSEDGREWSGTTGNQDFDVFYFGAEAKYTYDDMATLWAIGIYETGDAEVVDSDVEYDVSGYVAALGFEVDLDETVEGFGVHGQVFYASGDDDLTDDKSEGFYVPRGQSYYWSEIMGLGTFDYAASNGSPGDTISNIIAGNIGLSYQLTDDLTITGDLWYAEHAETNQVVTEEALGTEVDLRLDYLVNDDLKLALVGAYLFADDGTTMGAEDESDVMEVGLQLEFSFSTL